MPAAIASRIETTLNGDAEQALRFDLLGDERRHDRGDRDGGGQAHAVLGMSELESATIAVNPATATAATRPAQPSGGSVIITANVIRIRTRTTP